VGAPIYEPIAPEDLRQVILELGGVREQEVAAWK